MVKWWYVIYITFEILSQMSKSKYIQRQELPELPEPAISLINKGLSSLWQIEPMILSDNSVAVYLFRLNKTEFRYLSSNGSPLPIRPERVGDLTIIECVRFEDYEDETEKFVKNLLQKV